MARIARLARLLAAAAAAGMTGCSTPSAAGDASDVDDTDSAADAHPEPDVDRQGGPITLVVAEAAFTEERLCDFDGDGVGDNAIADLGPPAAGLFAASVTSILHGYISEGMRVVIHFPWVDDILAPDDPETTMIMFFGSDGPETWNPSDDFSGSASLYALAESLDACGEPTSVLAAGIAGGQLTAEGETFPVPLDSVNGKSARATGTLAPAGTSAEVMLCGYLELRDLGRSAGSEGDLTLLEILLAGGEPEGVPLVAGLTPDVDLDDDGLERLLLDDEWHITTCLDGDGTVSSGRDCWDEDRMADAFSVALILDAVSASFAGRHPSWQVGAGCEAGMPDQSLFDPR